MKRHPAPARQRGIVLATAMIILMVMSVLAVSMMRNFGLLERMADNTRDKQRAFNAAQNSLQYAEFWLTQGNGGSGTVCTGTLATSVAQVCSNGLLSTAANASSAQLTNVPWTTSGGAELGVLYKPPRMNAAGIENFYNDQTRWYVTSLGVDPSATLQLYQVSAWSQGGSANSIAVVQSVFGVRSNIIDAGAL